MLLRLEIKIFSDFRLHPSENIKLIFFLFISLNKRCAIENNKEIQRICTNSLFFSFSIRLEILFTPSQFLLLFFLFILLLITWPTFIVKNLFCHQNGFLWKSRAQWRRRRQREKSFFKSVFIFNSNGRFIVCSSIEWCWKIVKTTTITTASNLEKRVFP